MKTFVLGFILLFNTLTWAQGSDPSLTINGRVYSERFRMTGHLVAITSSEKGSVQFDTKSQPTTGVWLDELGTADTCDLRGEICVGDKIENTLTLSGNPSRGTILEIFQMTKVTIIGRVLKTSIYRIKFADKEKFLNGQFLRKAL